MSLQCLTWIPHIFHQLFSPFKCHEEVFRPLSDDTITDILTRLPTDCLVQCRSVCKHWRVLSSAPYFASLHLERSTSSLFVQCHDRKSLFIFDENAKKNKRIMKIRTSPAHIMNCHWPVLSGSCNGLLLFRSAFCMSKIFIFNPIKQEEITLTGPVQAGYLCGIYFRALTSEYKLLYAYKNGNCFHYLACTVGENIWRELDSFSYLPQLKASAPATVNGSIHWMIRHDYRNVNNINHCVNAIMVFSTDSETFRVMPHPGNECGSSKHHRKNILLLVMKESLCLCHLYGKLVDIWVLEEYENWVWVSRYRVDLDCDVRRYPHTGPDDFGNMKMKILGIQNSEMLVVWDSSGLFWYNLEMKRVRKVVTKKGKFTNYLCYSTVYTKSLVSLSGSYA
ncbi:hypothetical protein LguiA_026753 [Lonicera macranthoides]